MADKNSKVEAMVEIQKIVKERNISLGDLISISKECMRAEQEDKIKNKVSENEKYVGRCFCVDTKPRSGMFPKMKRFIKVISERSSSEHRVECLTFTEHPTYWFEYQSHLAGFAGDYYLGNFEFKSFEVRDIMINELDSMQEISSAAFDKHARKYLEELLSTKWYPDHYRYGGILPTDPAWPKKDS